MHRSDEIAARSAWRRRHPGEVLALAVGLMACAVGGPSPTGWIVAIAALATLLFGARIPARAVARTAIVPVAAIALASAAVVPVLEWRAGALEVVALDFAAAGQALQRACGGLLAMLLLGLTTRVSDLLRVLHRLGVPRAICELALAMHRMLVILVEEGEATARAVTLRGGTLHWRARWRGVVHLAAALLPRALHRGDQMARAMALRAPDGLLHAAPRHRPLRLTGFVDVAAILAIPAVVFWWSR